MKTFDLNKSDLKFEKGEVLNNYQKLYKKYGDHFYIQYKKIKLPVFLYLDNLENSTRKIYILKYATKNPADLYPFKIEFNYYTENSNNAHISNINKISTKEYPDVKHLSGSEVVEFVLNLLKKLYVEKAYLSDGASVHCEDEELPLSQFKLLEKKRTFYMKFGFKPELQQMQKIWYTNINSFTKIMQKSIEKIKSIKIEDIRKYCKKIIHLILKIYIKNDFDKVELLNEEPTKYSYYSNKMNKKTKIEKLAEKLNTMIELLDILPKKGSLWLWLKKIFYKDCKKYILFKNNLLNQNFKIIIYNNKIYKNPFVKPFFILSQYTRNKFVIDLTKFYE